MSLLFIKRLLHSNIQLANECDYISVIMTSIDKIVIKKLHEINVKMISIRSLGVDHIDMQCAKELGIHVSNATYSPNGVADYEIMLMMMDYRNMKRIMERANIQDFSLQDIPEDIARNAKFILVSYYKTKYQNNFNISFMVPIFGYY